MLAKYKLRNILEVKQSTCQCSLCDYESFIDIILKYKYANAIYKSKTYIPYVLLGKFAIGDQPPMLQYITT